MNTSDNTILLDNYLGLLKSLSRENKIKLVVRLTHEIAEETDKKGEDVIDKFYGAFKSNPSDSDIDRNSK
ncbi:hypothetical protein EZS27_020582 [termite gut metagenome]|uniref:Uncharacterized protein n=1 Tax=termite gut metagenome TaxID=433724 RepID=A0A5J4RAU7_9ZZZZ